MRNSNEMNSESWDSGVYGTGPAEPPKCRNGLIALLLVMIIFLCGIITVLIRLYGGYPEGVSFAILLMNILTPQIDKLTMKKPLGGKEA